MPYINTITGEYPLDEKDIKNQYPNVSFAHPFKPPGEYVFVFEAPKPVYDPEIQDVIQTSPVTLADGKLYTGWEIREKYTTPAERNAAKKAIKDANDKRHNDSVQDEINLLSLAVIPALVRNDVATVNLYKTKLATLEAKRK